jgi:phage/plasmid-like protein (TIGR03299 family)
MAHEILQHDQLISARNINPWHQLGEVKESFTIPDLYRIMDWEVKKVRLATIYEDDEENAQYFLDSLPTDSYATVRLPRNKDESPIVLGDKLSKSYQILQNEELIKIVEPFVEQGCAIETAGTLLNGKRVWVMLRLAKDLHVGKNDVIQKYIMVSNDHTGAQAAKFGLIGIRVVCANTLNAAEVDKKSQLIRILHQGNISENLKTVASMLDDVNGEFVNYGIRLETLTRTGINSEDLKKYVKNCLFAQFSENRKEERADKIAATQDKIIQLFETGAGSDLPEAKGTVYGAYQAVNSFLNHNRTIALEKRLPSLVWGHRSVTDKKALQLALKLAA